MPTFATLDVFTETPFAGNPLAVVEGAEGLSTAQMQTLAREFNLSETVFVLPPDNPAHRARVRIFTPMDELPFAGHPTIGCAIHLACADHPAGDFACTLVLEEGAGPVPVQVTRRGAAIAATLTAPVIPHAATAGAVPNAALLAAALGLSEDAIGAGDHAPAVWQGGPRFLYVPLPDPERLAHARPSEPAWSEIMQIAAVDSAYLYTPVPGGYRARMFSPTGGIPEDPATGSAVAILAAQLLASGALDGAETVLTVDQGIEMGRPSRIGLRVLCEGGKLREVQVTGSAVPVSQGRIARP